MEQIYVRFYANLNDFLPLEKRQNCFVHLLKEPAAIKDTIEALGVPHPEVALILVNGESVDFSYLVQDGDRITVYPQFTHLAIDSLSQVQLPPLAPIRFILDTHLGKLATYLRLLGFDTLYQNNYQDQELAELSSQTRRVLLTRDRGLLKRSIVTYGYCVRQQDPEQQVLEVLQRFDLFDKIAPLQRCLRCNGLLISVAKETICDRLPPRTQQHYDEFAVCQNCDNLYWQGSHYQRLQQFVDRIVLAERGPS
jgi:uncharacterized protein with PIN domain